MGLLDRLRRPQRLSPPNVQGSWAQAGEWIEWESPRDLIRESHYQKAIEGIVGSRCEEGYLVPVAVVLRREPANSHDSNAIRAEVNGRLVGYVRREIAAAIAPEIDGCRCSTFTVCGLVRGGSDRAPSLGIHVWLARRLSDGPEVAFGDAVHEVSWPPSATERARAIGPLR